MSCRCATGLRAAGRQVRAYFLSVGSGCYRVPPVTRSPAEWRRLQI